MSSEVEQCEDKLEDGQESQKRNCGISIEYHWEEVKEEPPNECDNEENIQTQIATNTTQPMHEQLPKSQNCLDVMNLETLDTNVTVKEEPVNEVINSMSITETTVEASDMQRTQISDSNANDFNMPISKSAVEPSDTQNAEISAPIEIIEKQKNGSNNEHLKACAAKTASAEYLDGIATPLLPRLRVKTEFALLKTPQLQALTGNDFFNKESGCVDAENVPVPPPPTFPSNPSSDSLADGIATPRILLASTNRLRVKTELSLMPATPQHNIEEPYHLLGERESGEVSPSASDDASEDEQIPLDFFDDLLHDKLKERIQEAQNNEWEEKYSDRLKEAERLKALRKDRRKSRKKQKKSKKKSRKRSRSRSLSPNSTREGNFSNLVDQSYHERNKRSRNEILSSSRREGIEEYFLGVDAGINVKSEFPENNLENAAQESAPLVENVEEIEEVLTPKQKRERAMKHAEALLKYIKIASDNNSNVFSTFPFVSTVRKLPSSHSYVQQHMYENRSPLHTVNNVSYKFNSHTTHFNMDEWGLAALPPNAAKMAKLVGCDAQFIHNKLQTIKIPAKLKKVKIEPNKDLENEEEEELIESNSSLYSNAMTQTDNVNDFNMPHNKRSYEIGVQVEPNVYSIGCQTLETKSPTEDIHKDDEAPIMKIIHDLNENQLMAIHAFGELIKEPNTTANAMEMYKIQMKILDIYKMSQIPSTFAKEENAIVNNYTTMSKNTRNQSQICIQSVKGADGKQFSLNDPRAKSTAYAKRIINDDVDSLSNYDSRSSTSQRSQKSYSRSSGNEDRYHSGSFNNSPSSRSQQNSSHNNQRQPTTAKHYGRGGLRR